ncbi:TPA: WxL domain-containing protein [Enterococcus faecalis]|uniref:WxL domain-containing protein n=1 Tax=Enterococcus TaxID=1350 RepID=UPI00053BE6F7|nr:WxL domain-containing protein [Enterococcus faecalis]EKJ5015348.1 WxL domain-containing protein [Enterococcus faecalis]KII40503.1 signal peptide protein, YSIRK family [Enterococcus faecalis]MDT2184604.1 WxL domain-containing protein [Enterococcus faecalis]UTJ09077.1 WxL domain-containing protein [Enterococcus faecalis]HBI2113423.1 WxL domain-containing protein [Enterococcus faecalis]
MKKKIMASLLVGSAVVGASLAPLSAQAVTTGNTPVQVEFGAGVLLDHDSEIRNVDPDPSTSNTDFDLLAIPKSLNFSSMKIGDDLSNINLLPGEQSRSVMVGDLRGTKEGWHVTGEITAMSNGSDKLEGNINFELATYYAEYLPLATPDSGYYAAVETQNGVNIANNPAAPSSVGTNMKIGGEATTLMTASVGKGQGTWAGRFNAVSLNITTPMQELKKGAYTGNITWNLVAGPSI